MTRCLLEDQDNSRENPVQRMIEAPIGNCSDTKKAQMAEFYNSRFPADYVESINLIDNAQCIDTSGLYLESVGLYSNFAQVRIEFEHCVVTAANQTASDCPNIHSNATGYALLSEAMYLHVDFKQIDVENVAEPVISQS